MLQVVILRGAGWDVRWGCERPPPSPGVEVHIEVGDILLFDGDVVHAGAAYTSANTRLHVYLDVAGVGHEANTTYLVKG